eukprot:scaffold246325_cov39-Tisochrysis_lutea.AAC.1
MRSSLCVGSGAAVWLAHVGSTTAVCFLPLASSVIAMTSVGPGIATLSFTTADTPSRTVPPSLSCPRPLCLTSARAAAERGIDQPAETWSQRLNSFRIVRVVFHLKYSHHVGVLYFGHSHYAS